MRTILSLRSDLAFSPEQVEGMARAFSEALEVLGDQGRTTVARELVSSSIIAAALSGENDAARLREAGVTGFRLRRA